jgi:hypothetical protein
LNSGDKEYPNLSKSRGVFLKEMVKGVKRRLKIRPAGQLIFTKTKQLIFLRIRRAGLA